MMCRPISRAVVKCCRGSGAAQVNAPGNEPSAISRVPFHRSNSPSLRSTRLCSADRNRYGLRMTDKLPKGRTHTSVSKCTGILLKTKPHLPERRYTTPISTSPCLTPPHSLPAAECGTKGARTCTSSSGALSYWNSQARRARALCKVTGQFG
jgi:hypothetical protein